MAQFSIDELINLADSNLLGAQNYFEEQYSYKRIIIKNLNSITLEPEDHEHTVIIRGPKLSLKTLQKIGCKITLLTVDFTEATDKFCHYLHNRIIEHCTSSLFHLKLVQMSEQSNLMKAVFTNLQTLEFQWCSITGQTINFNNGFPQLTRMIFTGWNIINQDLVKIRFSAFREIITTMYLPTHLRHFNIEMVSLANIKALNPNLNTSITALNEM